jgi:hypothetical protein
MPTATLAAQIALVELVAWFQWVETVGAIVVVGFTHHSPPFFPPSLAPLRYFDHLDLFSAMLAGPRSAWWIARQG